MSDGIRVSGIDHIVLNVSDVERSVQFYTQVLGLAPVRVEQWRKRQVPFPSVRVGPTTIIDLLHVARSGENMNHFCLVIEPTDFQALIESGRLDVVEGPATRFGAQGDGQSLYVRDPDRNVVELRYYGPGPS